MPVITLPQPVRYLAAACVLVISLTVFVPSSSAQAPPLMGQPWLDCTLNYVGYVGGVVTTVYVPPAGAVWWVLAIGLLGLSAYQTVESCGSWLFPQADGSVRIYGRGPGYVGGGGGGGGGGSW